MKPVKTNAMRMLDKAKIPYELFTYQVDESNLSGTHVAEDVGLPYSQVFKTLVAKGDKTGYVVGLKAVNDENEIMMITTGGIIIQLRMDDISTLGRITSGVKLINLEKGIKVAKIAKVREKISNGDQEFDNVDDALEEITDDAQNTENEEKIKIL